jgi:transposase
VEPLITGLDFDALIADKAFDNNALRATLNERGALAVIQTNASRAGIIPYDKEIYKWRHLVENFFQKIKEFCRIATRGACPRAGFRPDPGDKSATSYTAAIYLAGAFLALE